MINILWQVFQVDGMAIREDVILLLWVVINPQVIINDLQVVIIGKAAVDGGGAIACSE